MSGAQYDFGTINPVTKSGAGLAADLNAWRDAVHSMHRGPSRPAYVKTGMMWVKEVSSTTWEIYFHVVGGFDILWGVFNPTLQTFEIGSGIRAGGIPSAAVTQGPGSGLNADLLDGRDSSGFQQAGENVTVAQTKTLTFGYSVKLDAFDGTVGVRHAGGLGLNIIGVASEGNGIRYTTMFGDTTINGALTVQSGSGINSPAGPIVASNGNRLEAQGSPPWVIWNRVVSAPYTWGSSITADGYLTFKAGTNQAGAGGADVVVYTKTGQIWSATYGWLDQAFANRNPLGGNGPVRIQNCGTGDVPTSSGFELYEESGRLRIRVFNVNCTNCSNCVHNCACDCS